MVDGMNEWSNPYVVCFVTVQELSSDSKSPLINLLDLFSLWFFLVSYTSIAQEPLIDALPVGARELRLLALPANLAACLVRPVTTVVLTVTPVYKKKFN